MKFLLMLFITFTLSNADEIQRVGDILKDIGQLRIDYQESQDKIAQLEDIIEKQKKLLSKKTVLKTKKVTKQILFNKCEEPNPFPQLMMKEDNEVHSFKASAFRVNKLASIYDGVKGNVIQQWGKSTSFTSDKKTSSMIKITGYFIDKQWKSASSEMWIKAQDARKR
ncbi:MAG: hypothetical protein QM497_03470 [Sulfurimonas sp.]